MALSPFIPSAFQLTAWTHDGTSISGFHVESWISNAKGIQASKSDLLTPRETCDIPQNEDDNALYCGGFGVQHDHNGGKCGICGDPWDAFPRWDDDDDNDDNDNDNDGYDDDDNDNDDDDYSDDEGRPLIIF